MFSIAKIFLLSVIIVERIQQNLIMKKKHFFTIYLISRGKDQGGMNIVNVKNFRDLEIAIPSTKHIMLRELFSKQRELLNKYQTIEEFDGKKLSEYIDENGKLKTIHTLQSQRILKDFSWRVTEELAECCEGLFVENDLEHVGEEVADALHFLLELLIVSGLTEHDFVAEDFMLSIKSNDRDDSVIRVSMMDFIYALGIAVNRLKAKIWKQSQILVDEKEFKRKLKIAFIEFWRIPFALGFGSEDVYKFYFRKHAVNVFRVKSNY
jgi:dimeric dUTPase (all-alpha-NTP-PPase superfamily)